MTLKLVKNAAIKDSKYPGFSERLNQLLDWANFPPFDNGRAKYLGERFGCSKSGARKWIREDTPPRPDTLHNIAAVLKEEIGYAHDVSKLIAWILS